MIFAIKLIIIHITLINVQFRHVDVDAEEAAQAAIRRKENREKFDFDSINYWAINSPNQTVNILGMFDWRYGYAVGENPFALGARIVRKRPPAAERQIGRRRGELGRAERWRGHGILEPVPKREGGDRLIINGSLTVPNQS